MSYRQDGIGRTIHDMLRMAGIIMTGAFQEKYKQPKFIENGAQEEWQRQLLLLIDKGKINEAENELLEWLETEKEAGALDRVSLEMALGVYGYMNEKEDAFLEENGFSREEILEGVQGLLILGGIGLT